MTATPIEESKGIRTYGGLRQSRGIGLFGLGSGATALMLACIAVPILSFNVSGRLALVLAIPCAVVAVFLVVRIDGVPLGDMILRRVQWWLGSLRGYPSLRAGVVLEHPRAWQLPGVLAPTRLVSVEDPGGGRYGLVWNQRSGLMTATLKCSASTTGLADARDADIWINNWHEWLASLGYLPMISHVAVTIDTAPEPGSTLADNVFSRLDPHAPEDARQLMQELVWRSPAAAADVDTRVSITFNPGKGETRTKGLADQTAEISRHLVGLEAALASCGVGVLGRATDYELSGLVRTAFDPTARGEVNRLVSGSQGDAAELLEWGEAGPVAAEEHWDSYQHDSGISVSWAWTEPPRQAVASDVLARLVSPGNHPKRVTLMYRPVPAGEAARILETQVNAAMFRQQWRAVQKREETARDRTDRDLALRAAQEEAQGAGLVLVSMYVTVTVDDPDNLSSAIADVEARADQSKIRLRKLFGSQALGFATTLPAGVCPPLLSSGLAGKG